LILKRIYFYIFKSNCTYKQQKKTAQTGGLMISFGVSFFLLLQIDSVLDGKKKARVMRAFYF
jgi:hypothetical protein